MIKRTILLIEDNEDDVFLTKRALKKKNISHILVIAEDGKEALNYLFEENGQVKQEPNLILLDLKLPKIDGLQVLQKVKSEPTTRNIPVVVLSTSSQDEDIVKSYNIGANSYVRKPVDSHQFSDMVGQLGAYWLTLNEPLP